MPGGRLAKRSRPGRRRCERRRGQQGRQVPAAVAEVVLQVIALGLEHVEAFVLDLPARPATSRQLGDVVRANGNIGWCGNRPDIFKQNLSSALAEWRALMA